jgi:hypothetical protein
VAVAVAASAFLTPDQVQASVLPPGGYVPLVLADRLYSAPEWSATRERYQRASIERMPTDPELSPRARLWHEAQASARLGQRDDARKLMSAALLDDSDQPDWREGFIDWLHQWGDLPEASRQARIALTLHPGHPGLERAPQSALDALARGEAPPERPD